MPNKEVEVTFTFKWTIKLKEWLEGVKHNDEIEKKLKAQLAFDPVNVMFFMNNIKKPDDISYTLKAKE